MSVLAAAAEHIAVTMIREAFAHLPAERASGAMAMANTEPMRKMLQAVTVEAYSQGQEAGVRQGRLELEREMEDDWKPIAERVRQSAGAPTLAQLNEWRAANGLNAQRADHPGGPVAPW